MCYFHKWCCIRKRNNNKFSAISQTYIIFLHMFPFSFCLLHKYPITQTKPLSHTSKTKTILPLTFIYLSAGYPVKPSGSPTQHPPHDTRIIFSPQQHTTIHSRERVVVCGVGTLFPPGVPLLQYAGCFTWNCRVLVGKASNYNHNTAIGVCAMYRVRTPRSKYFMLGLGVESLGLCGPLYWSGFAFDTRCVCLGNNEGAGCCRMRGWWKGDY